MKCIEIMLIFIYFFCRKIRVINLTERMGDKAVLSDDSFNMATPALALSMINVDPDSFRGVTFCVSNFSAGTIPEVNSIRGIQSIIPEFDCSRASDHNAT